MAVSESYLAYILERLERVVPVTARKMFGGVGLYSDQTFFALIDDDTLYFKVNATNESDYVEAGMRAFRPFGQGSYAMRYYSVPEQTLEDDDLLRQWATKALAAAKAVKRRKR